MREGTATDQRVFYVRMVNERFGFDLLDSYDRQSQLCSATCDAVDAKEPYDRLVAGHYELLQYEASGTLPRGSAQELVDAVGHPFGIEG